MSTRSRSLAWLQFLVALLVLVWGAAGRASPQELHQVSGSVFSFSPLPWQSPFRYGPFDKLSPDARFARLMARFRERLQTKHVPGGSVAIVLDGHLAYSAGVGLLRSEGEARVSAHSRFLTASLSKMVLAATIMSLAERDGLVLDQPLKAELPYFARGDGYDPSLVTLRTLLDHTSGVPDTGDPRPLPLRALIEAHATDPLLSPPGRLFNYSNAGYALLAAAVEARTARPFEQVVAERIFGPCSMRDAGYDLGRAPQRVCAGHDASGKVIWSRPSDSSAAHAAGGVIASVVDFAHFAEMLLARGGSVLSTASVDAMMEGHALAQDEPKRTYGYGLFASEHAGLPIIEHAGSAAGFSSLVRLVPSRNFAVVVFDNGPFAPDELADAAMSAFLDVPEVPRARVQTLPESWEEYVGRYGDAVGALGEFEIALRGGHLWFERKAGRPLPSTLRGRFERDASGKIQYFVTRMGVAERRP
ncbi:MAG TPA: serine hydrolase domain-containing protein [Polyangiaceae bacterium]|nr:serine hydrolase domain-containing protein [Polyangiaceae bacterium]